MHWHLNKPNRQGNRAPPKIDTMNDYSANLAFFLLDKTGSIFGRWHGRMTAAAQRELFGRYIGKGTIVIDGDNETIRNTVKACFGLDYEDRNVTQWRTL